MFCLRLRAMIRVKGVFWGRRVVWHGTLGYKGFLNRFTALSAMVISDMQGFTLLSRRRYRCCNIWLLNTVLLGPPPFGLTPIGLGLPPIGLGLPPIGLSPFGLGDNLAPRTIWHRGQFGTGTIWHQECKRGQFGT